ncbi:hypothetical protein NDU88_005065 [Pleurodeles waltl]|uniref:Uncharacterized protein n=1 Tax=Pleurodeles waltl TaxID=8319 RepID=A0AAV7W727_PLEWA|nr:hypothetical protein NDU88_005065 [Pleurodeles waltl]
MKPHLIRQLVDTMRELQLQDLWCHRNPTIREYSCYTPAANTYSRLDYCLVSKTLSPLIQAIAYFAHYLSDRSHLLVKLNKSYTPPVVLMCWLRLEALSEAPFAGAVRDGLTQFFDINWGTSTTRRCDEEAIKVVHADY